MQLVLVCFVAALGGLLFGYDWVVIGGAKPFYESYFAIEDAPLLQGFTMSSALVGCLIGAVLSGALADRLGRKRLLIATGFLFLASALGTAIAQSLATFTFFRIVGGVGIGLASNLSPMYIAEISPATQRGRLVSVNQMTIVVGVLAAQFINWSIARHQTGDELGGMLAMSWNVTTGWRWMFAAQAFPAVVFLVWMFFMPESPRWLVSQNRSMEALTALTRLGGRAFAQAQLTEIQRWNQTDAPEMRPTTASRSPRRLLLLGIFLAVFQQWCGINVMFNYAEEIFAAAGFSVDQILWNIVITGIVNLLFTFVAIWAVDRLGRRLLMMVGSGGLTILYALLGACYFYKIQGYLPLVLVLSAIACYAMSLAPVTWVILSEIFPVEIRGRAMAKCVFALWTACTALTLTFPVLNSILGSHGILFFYGGICLIGFVTISIALPETREVGHASLGHADAAARRLPLPIRLKP